jgi:hypothetical protein
VTLRQICRLLSVLVQHGRYGTGTYMNHQKTEDNKAGTPKYGSTYVQISMSGTGTHRNKRAISAQLLKKTANDGDDT